MDMHEKPLPYWHDEAWDFYLPMGGPPDDEPEFGEADEPEFGEDALPAHPDDDFRFDGTVPTLTDDIPF